MRCAAIVAHPDDCVIFAWPLMRYLRQHEWTVIYLTYDRADPRGHEMSEFWKGYGVETVFLGYKDDYLDLESGVCSFDTISARQDILAAIEGFDLLLTHNQDGDYGHLHHKFVNSCVESCIANKIYFASTFNNNFEISCDEKYDVSQLPLHREVIEGFQDRYIGRYWANEQVMEKLGWAH